MFFLTFYILTVLQIVYSLGKKERASLKKMQVTLCVYIVTDMGYKFFALMCLSICIHMNTSLLLFVI